MSSFNFIIQVFGLTIGVILSAGVAAAGLWILWCEAAPLFERES